MTARAASEVLGDVVDELDEVFAGLGDLGRAFGALTAEPLRRADVETLRPEILALLAAHADLLTGAGVVTRPGLLADAPRWLEWWWGPGPELLRVNLDPAAPDFYDYTTTEWFAATEPCMAGPYVDYACTNEYAITLAVPVPGFGVAAADVLVANLELRVLPALVALDRPAALTNAQGRIVASNAPALAPGLRLAVPARAASGWLLVEPSVS
jgi:hypothetical protein